MAATKKKSTKAPAEPFEKALSLVWVGLDDSPVRAVNNTISQVHDDLFILSFGFTNPPVLVGTPKAIKEQMDSLERVLVTPVARIAVTEAHLEKVIGIFRDTLNRYRKQKDGKK